MSVFLILAIVCALVATRMGFDWITSTHYFGWLALTLFFYLLSLLVPYSIGPRRAP